MPRFTLLVSTSTNSPPAETPRDYSLLITKKHQNPKLLKMWCVLPFAFVVINDLSVYLKLVKGKFAKSIILKMARSVGTDTMVWLMFLVVKKIALTLSCLPGKCPCREREAEIGRWLTNSHFRTDLKLHAHYTCQGRRLIPMR